MLLGGRVAEELVLDQMTTGAANDIERATKMARKMVCKWGMSDKLGPLAFGNDEEHPFLGRELSHQKDYSEETARAIDDEVRRIMENAHDKAKSLINEHIEVLHKIAEALLERETISGKEIDILLDGGELPENGMVERAKQAEKDMRSKSGPGYTPLEETDKDQSPAEDSGGKDEDSPSSESEEDFDIHSEEDSEKTGRRVD